MLATDIDTGEMYVYGFSLRCLIYILYSDSYNLFFVALRLLVVGPRNLHVILLVLAMLLRLARHLILFLTVSLRLTPLPHLAFLARVIRSFPPSLSDSDHTNPPTEQLPYK